MAILTPPSFTKFTSSRFGLNTVSLNFPGVLVAGGQTVEIPVDLWVLEVAHPKMRPAEAAGWRSFFTQIRGPGGRFYAGDPDRMTPRGEIGGTPLVNGASESGSSLSIDGATAGVSAWLKTGDYFAIDMPSGHRELKLITQNIDTDGGGAATLQFTPPLRETPADNATVIVSEPTTVMQFVDETIVWDGDRNGNISFSFRAVESVNIPD